MYQIVYELSLFSLLIFTLSYRLTAKYAITVNQVVRNNFR